MLSDGEIWSGEVARAVADVAATPDPDFSAGLLAAITIGPILF